MGESFNPYAAWLDIDTVGRPDHYALLGLRRFESDPQRITLAADDRIALLRKMATKERLAAARGLAQEILAARNCLLSATDRAAYDAQFGTSQARERATPSRSVAVPPRAYEDGDDDVEPEAEAAPLEGIALPPEPSSPPAALVVEPPVVASPRLTEPLVPEPAFVVRPPREVTPRKPVAKAPILLSGVLMAVLGAGAAVFVPQWLQGTTPRLADRNSAPTPNSQRNASSGEGMPAVAQVESDAAPATAGEDSPADSSAGAPAATEREHADEESTADDMTSDMATPTIGEAEPEAMPAETTAPVANDADHDATLTTLAAARKAMGNGDLETATDQVDLAELEALDTAAAELVAHDRAVLEYLKGFWRAADEGFKQLTAGMEFEWEARTVVVVERTPDRLIIRATGRNRAYDRKRLPPDLAILLANRWLKVDDANTPLFLAAFHLLDADGDRAEARRLLETARSAGTDGVDVLLPELEREVGK